MPNSVMLRLMDANGPLEGLACECHQERRANQPACMYTSQIARLQLTFARLPTSRTNGTSALRLLLLFIEAQAALMLQPTVCLIVTTDVAVNFGVEQKTPRWHWFG